jgi:hypothetical protein
MIGDRLVDRATLIVIPAVYALVKGFRLPRRTPEMIH